jgi:DNA modification methylase
MIKLIHGKWQDHIDSIGEVDLILTDPPYGIAADSIMAKDSDRLKSKNSKAKTRVYQNYNWDKIVSDEEMKTIISKGKRAVIWGGNYYKLDPSAAWIVWNKLNGGMGYADCELAWSNMDMACRYVEHRWNGFLREGDEPRFHPRQKPLAVMGFCLDLYIKKYGKPKLVFDPFAGSATTLKACQDRGIDCVGTEMIEEYYLKANQRLAQQSLF